jgi:hemerythrin
VALLRLEDNLKLDIPEIDSQHETLIGLVNRLHEAMLQGTGREILDGLLSQLIEHTRYHFSYEEQLMSQYDYPEYEAHRLEHNRLMQQLVDLAERFRSGELLLSFAVVLEIKGWATIHIEKSDKPLGAFLKSREETGT